MNMTTVYVRLLDEGTDVYRPTQAEQLSKGVFKLYPTLDYDSEDEAWEFPPGQIVVCEEMNLHGGLKLVATRQCRNAFIGLRDGSRKAKAGK
jgi:hypothetical protein